MVWELKINKSFVKRREALELARAINKDFDLSLVTKRKKKTRRKK